MIGEQKKKQLIEEREDTLIRILGHDIPSSKNIYTGLTKIKGFSWSISNFICTKLKLNKNIRFFELNKEQIREIEDTVKKINCSDYLKNRRKDFDGGETKHLLGNDLDMRKDFDIKRLKQIKSFKGIRHAFRLPVRGQSTRSHFRKSGIVVGVRKPKVGKKG